MIDAVTCLVVTKWLTVWLRIFENPILAPATHLSYTPELHTRATHLILTLKLHRPVAYPLHTSFPPSSYTPDFFNTTYTHTHTSYTPHSHTLVTHPQWHTSFSYSSYTPNYIAHSCIQITHLSYTPHSYKWVTHPIHRLELHTRVTHIRVRHGISFHAEGTHPSYTPTHVFRVRNGTRTLKQMHLIVKKMHLSFHLSSFDK